MPRDPIIPPMNIAPEELARRLMQKPKKAGAEEERPKTRRSPKAGKADRGQRLPAATGVGDAGEGS